MKMNPAPRPLLRGQGREVWTESQLYFCVYIWISFFYVFSFSSLTSQQRTRCWIHLHQMKRRTRRKRTTHWNPFFSCVSYLICFFCLLLWLIIESSSIRFISAISFSCWSCAACFSSASFSAANFFFCRHFITDCHLARSTAASAGSLKQNKEQSNNNCI